jgi:pyruvate/2-oxoglutarate dehydrogenase complex dihydrolipoamide acyltransferase (E2) component
MATRLLAPSMGEGVEELTIMDWLKKEGEPVKEFELVVELETDKVTTEIPSPVAGTLLKIIAQKDTVVKVGSTLAWIGEPGEAVETTPPPAKNAQPAKVLKAAASAPASALPERTEYKGPVSPLVKQIAITNQVDLNLVNGTGLDGRITKEDILSYVESKETPAPAAAPQPSLQPLENKLPVPELRTGNLIPHTPLRRQIAERMVNSQHTSPHVLTVMEADLSKVVAHRAANKELFANQGVNLTLTAYFCSAIVNAIKTSPEVNSSWAEDGIQLYKVINLGVATSLGKDGLIVPVIKDAGSLSLQGLAQKINDLSSRARAKKLLPEEVKGGTFTLTNHGSGGSLFASPIIFQPQAAILGTGIMQKRPIVVTDGSGNDAIAIRPMIYLSLVFDHRILDGESADRFLKTVKESLENWS